MDKLKRPSFDPAPIHRTESSTKPAANQRVAKTTLPKPRHDVGLAWLVVLGLALLAMIPLMIDLGTPAVWSETESRAVAISSETTLRQTAIADGETSMQSWTPVYRGESQWQEPPGGTWFHQVMFLGLVPDRSALDPETNKAWVVRGRIGSVLMAVLFVGAVFWAGYSLGGLTTGVVAALIAMTMPLLIGFGRHANSEIIAMAWSALSIAGALWAMRPLRAAPSLARQLIGWLVCGAGLGLATLTAGPTAIPGTLFCTVAVAMFCPRRLGHVMGLLASSAVAALIVTPWVLHVIEQDPAIWQRWYHEVRPDFAAQSIGETLGRAGWRLVIAATFCGVWVVWLVPALTQPFSTSTGQARRRMLIGWGWLIVASLLLAFEPGPTRLSTLLIAVAPASVCIALTIQQYHDLSGEGRHAKLWLFGRWIACTMMIGLGIALPVLGYLVDKRPDLVAWLPRFDRPMLASMHWSFYAGAGVALLLASLLAVRFARANHPGRTTACLALWLLIAYSLAAIPISRGQLFNTPFSETPLNDTRPESR
ncbi:MAG: ArnT family glycosyltransferase [Phycisphaeraceae bacterium]